METIEATPEHPFFTAKGMVAAKELGIGTEILTRAGPQVKDDKAADGNGEAGSTLIVASLTRQPAKSTGGVAVFNFEVEDFHTYFVGQAGGGAWVHNACNPAQEAAAIRKIQNTIVKHARLGPRGEVSGAAQDLLGNPVPKVAQPGQYWDHLKELEDAMRGLEKNAELLRHSTNPAAQAARQQALDHLTKIWEALGKELYP